MAVYIKRSINAKGLKNLKLINFKTVKNEDMIVEIKKITKKSCIILTKKLNRYKIKQVIIEEGLKENEELKNSLKSKGIDIKNYKNYLINYIGKIIEFILPLIKKEFYEIDLHVIVKKFKKEYINMIDYLAEKVKTVNIITTDLKNYTRYEECLYKEKGINVTVSNNKKKSLEKAKIIINIDYIAEELLQYNINRKCIIINLLNRVEVKQKFFEGININSIDIDLEIQDEFLNFNKIEIQEEMGTIEKCNIKSIIGEKGEIKKEEFKNIFSNNIDKTSKVD